VGSHASDDHLEIGRALQVLANDPANLDQVMNVDDLLNYFASNALLANTDGFTGDLEVDDFYEYFDPTSGQLFILPWDPDNTFGSINDPPDRDIFQNFGKSAITRLIRDSASMRARFFTNIEQDTAGPDGIDRIEFWVETNPGTRPGPLMKVASGGELARFLLALKVVLADRGSAPTLVFDEIDTGVGGAVADAIGQRLARLASKVQVVAVTHAPQVAARADRHYVISKDTLARGKRVATSIAEVAAERRREEIARMLAGAEITDEARKAAERLIKAAG